MKSVCWKYFNESLQKVLKQHAEWCVFRFWAFPSHDSGITEVLTVLSQWGIDIEDFERCHAIISPLRE